MFIRSNNAPFYEYKEKMDEVAEAYRMQKRMHYEPEPVVAQEVSSVEENSNIDRDSHRTEEFRYSWRMAVMTLGRHNLTTYDRKAYASKYDRNQR